MGTLYNYFPSKTDIAFELFQQSTATAIDSDTAKATGRPSAWRNGVPPACAVDRSVSNQRHMQ